MNYLQILTIFPTTATTANKNVGQERRICIFILRIKRVKLMAIITVVKTKTKIIISDQSHHSEQRFALIRIRSKKRAPGTKRGKKKNTNSTKREKMRASQLGQFLSLLLANACSKYCMSQCRKSIKKPSLLQAFR